MLLSVLSDNVIPGMCIKNVKACCSDWLPACPLSDTHRFSAFQNALLFLLLEPEPVQNTESPRLHLIFRSRMCLQCVSHDYSDLKLRVSDFGVYIVNMHVDKTQVKKLKSK